MVKAVVPSSEVKKVVEPFVDPANLLLIDRDNHDFIEKKNQNVTEDQLKELARTNAQFLFNEVFKLPRKIVLDATCAILPDRKYDLPREKPVS